MSPNPAPISQESAEDDTWFDYLTPEQRIKAIAEILATAALRVMKERHPRR